MSDTKIPEDTNKYVAQMRDWINSQPHLPKDVDDRALLRFLHSCYYDLEKAKTAAELFFTIRSSSPELMTNRDPLGAAIQKCFKITNLAHIRTPDNKALWVWQLNDPGLDNYDYTQDAKLFFLTTDAAFLSDEPFPDADIVIMDVKDITLKFLTKFNMALAKKLTKYQQEAIPIRLKQVHIVNAPPFIDKLYALMKTFLKKEISELIHFHPPKSVSLYDYISKEDLPEDFGGSRGSLEEHMKNAVSLIMSKRDTLIDENFWRVVDKKNNKNKQDISNNVASFRTLAID